ncbi:MAG: hypothetical protein Q4C80_04490 [Bacillota bacterium]|nr:hypothetical protein [Bacillota bacterium]
MKTRRIAARITGALLIMLLAFSLTACGDGKKKSDKPVSHEITGNVIDADGTTMVIKKDDENLTFNYEGIDVRNFDNRDIEIGENQGDVAIIGYTGEINGDSTDSCKVTDIAIQPGEAKMLKGKLVDIVSTRSRITVNDGNSDLDFDVSAAERHYSAGLKVGDELIITYMGEITDGDTSNAYVCSVHDKKFSKIKEWANVDVEQVDENVWIKAPVCLREGSSYATEAAGSVDKGTEVKQVGIGNDGWSRIEYNGKPYCIPSTCIAKEQPSDNANVMTGKINYITVGKDSTEVQFNSEGKYYNFDISEAKLHFLGQNTTRTKMNLVYEGDMEGGTGSDLKVKTVQSIAGE